MTITKPFDKVLSRQNLESNNMILPGDEFYVCYADPTEPENPIGYINCGGDFEYFLQILDWLNDTRLAALIWIEDGEIAKGRGQFLPETLNPHLCFSYEGFFTEKNLIQNFQGIAKHLDKFLNPAMVWMLEKATKAHDVIIFMDSTGNFTKFGYYSWYIDEGITYFIHGKASKKNFYSANNQSNPYSSYMDC